MSPRTDAADALRAALAALDLEVEETEPGSFVVVLPGERKQKTTCSLVVGEHALTVQAFVARHVDENAEAVYRWLLERNLRMYGVTFAVDHLGDIYLSGRLPLESVTPDEVADCVMFALTRPLHVNLDEIVIKAIAQASGSHVVRRST